MAELQPQQLKSFMRKYPISYYSAIRPDAETTNQTMRMLGTYSSDFAFADQARIFIPSGCPGGPATGTSWFHPDVRLTASARRLQRAY